MSSQWRESFFGSEKTVSVVRSIQWPSKPLAVWGHSSSALSPLRWIGIPR